MDFEEFYRAFRRLIGVDGDFPVEIAAIVYACYDAGLSPEQTRRFLGRRTLVNSIGGCLLDRNLGPEAIGRIVEADRAGLIKRDLLAIFPPEQRKPEFR